MGNQNSCCGYSSPQAGRKELTGDNATRGLEEHLPEGEFSVTNLQHISEREPEDWDSDPSLHPCTGTIFMERSKQAIENGMVRKKSQYQIADTRPLKKSSSCSTIYLDDSTVSQPNLKNTVKCVALAVYYHIKNRTSQRQIDIFDEKIHPLTRDGVADDYDKHNPEHKEIYKFVRTLFNAAQLTAECAIITLVYLERLLTYAEIDITPANWKRIVLAAILLASKVWDDQAVWNVDYCQILKDITVEDMNELERQFLEMLQFNINVPSSVYAKYYFDLRTLAEANELTFPSEPLSKEKAQKLEAMSRVYEDKVTAEALRNVLPKSWCKLLCSKAFCHRPDQKMMMHHKVCSQLCRLCGKEKQRGTDVFKDKVKGAVLCSIINKYFPREVINIGVADALTKYVCIDCEQKICMFDEFCLMVANVQRQLVAPSLEIDFAEDMLCHLNENDSTLENVSGRGLDPRSKKLHTCQLCDKRFRCQAHLDRHGRIHTGQRPFACNICSMSFNQQEILNKHMESHQGRKEFRCANCQQSFRFKVSLKSHMINFHTETEVMRLDSVDSSLVCTECGKLFATRYKLRRHARCHTGERPYVCNYCNRTFSQTGNLKLHETKCQQNLVATCQISRLDDTTGQATLHQDPISYNANGNLDYCSSEIDASLLTSGPSCSTVSNVGLLDSQPHSLQHFQPMYISESEIQKTINETINSSTLDTGPSSYLIKNYDNPIFMDDEIETMLDHDLINLEVSKFTSTSVQDKLPMCLKQPETPELLHSLLYDD